MKVTDVKISSLSQIWSPN